MQEKRNDKFMQLRDGLLLPSTGAIERRVTSYDGVKPSQDHDRDYVCTRTFEGHAFH